MNEVKTVGVIGLGLMGSALAERFLAAGRRVVGFDLRDEARQRLVELGGEAVTSVKAVIEAASVVLLSLPNSDVVEHVCHADAGLFRNDGFLKLRIIDTTTGDPDRTAALGRRLSDAGIEYLDATLTGSSQQARDGEVVVTAGGSPAAFQQSEDLFRCFAKQWFHVGPWGSGARTKLVVNLVLGLNRAVLAEGLAFARACGLELPAVLEILRSGAAYSRVMDTKGRKMIDADFAPQAKLAQHLKDVRLILEAGRRAAAALPLSELHEQLLSSLNAQGLGDWDNSAIIRAFDGQPAVE